MKFPILKDSKIEERYQSAKEIYADYGIDTEKAIEVLKNIDISMHCWQGDDVVGFENKGGNNGGTLCTGNHPGVARTPDELRSDIEKSISLLPGKLSLNLHAFYQENDGDAVDRTEIGPKQFENWCNWAKEKKVGLDFNPTFFAHPKAESGFTLSSADNDIRQYWIEHAKRCREISAHFAKELNDDVVVNYWIPDGAKDLPADRWAPRERLTDSYNQIFKDDIDSRVKEALECKLFGIGSEEYVVGSSEYYLAYTLMKKKLLCLDMGHFHPTENIHDKLSAVLGFLPEVLVHVSRPIRWDSDHVVILNDDLMSLCREIVRGDVLNRVYLATDFFDASINRIGAWVTGIRSLQKALIFALLDPTNILKDLELAGKGAEKLALMEEAKLLPYADVWNYLCLQENVPTGTAWINDISKYENDILSKRK